MRFLLKAGYVASLFLSAPCVLAADYAYTPQWPNVRTYSPEWPNTAREQVAYRRDGWDGFTVGWNAGAGFAHGNAAIGIGGAQYSASQDLFGAVGGVQAGYSWQFGNWVSGLEGDIQASGQSREIELCPGCAGFCDPKERNSMVCYVPRSRGIRV